MKNQGTVVLDPLTLVLAVDVTEPTPPPGGGHSNLRQYAYVRMARVPFWPTSVSQRVGFSSNVPLGLGF